MGDEEKALNEAIKIVDVWMKHQVFINEIPGASLGIIFKDKIIFKQGYGYSNLETKKRTDNKTNYPIASISKLFTAIAIMQLIENGKLSLDTKIKDILPWFDSSHDKNLGNVIVKQLLTHSSGLKRDGDSGHWINDKFPGKDDLIKMISSKQIVQEPSKGFKYSNFGYAILGQVIEEVSGIDYEKYLRENIIGKIGMKNTFIDYRDKVKNLAAGYSRDLGKGRKKFDNVKTNAFASATGLVSNVDDLCKFLVNSLKDNDGLVSKDSKKEMQKIYFKPYRETDFGYCFGYESWKVGADRIVGHGGGFAGYRTCVAINNEKNLGVVLLANSIDVKVKRLISNAFHILFFGLNNFKRRYNKEFDKYEGTYSSRWGFVSFVNTSKGLLFFFPDALFALKEDSGCGRLEHLEEDSFTMLGGDKFEYINEEARFELDGEGRARAVYVGPNKMKLFDYGS